MTKLLRIFAFGLLLFGVTHATTHAPTGDLRNWMDTLNSSIPFGYAPTQRIKVASIAPDKVVIKSPLIKDELGNIIKKYTLMFSQYPLSQILENPALLDQSKEKTFDFPTPGTDITMELHMVTDTLSPVHVYYLSIIPKDQNWILWEISNEIWFKLATQTYGEGNATWSLSLLAHGAAGADMGLANITHTIRQNLASLKWIAVSGSDKVDIFLLDPMSQTFQRLTSLNMAAERYDFPLTRNGEYVLNFMPNNWGKEYRYSFVANWITGPIWGPSKSGPPVIGNLPPTGPKENLLIIIAFSLLAYIIYRKVTAKSKR